MLTLNNTLVLYGIIAGLFFAVLFCILFSNFNRKVLNKLNLYAKLLIYTALVTLILIAWVVYFCFTAVDFTVTTYLIISGIFIAYVLVILIVFYVLLKPIRDIEDITSELSIGKKNLEFEIIGSKEFDNIEENLLNVQNNYKNDDKKLNKKDYEYQKYLPNNYLKFLGKTRFEDVKVGDFKQVNVSIMFCDVRDSFFTSETMSLKDNFDIINNFVGLVSKEVRKFNGFVDKFMGDGVLAVFENEGDAILSAQNIQKKLDYENFVTIGINKIDYGIAVHSGSVIVGVVGDEKRKSATIISDAVNLVSKVEHLNKILKTKLLFTKEILNNIPSSIKYRFVGNMKFDDLTNEIAVFECLEGYGTIEKNALVKTTKIFESAVRNFEKEEFELAKKQFIEVLKNNANDYLTRFYLAKCNANLVKNNKDK